MNTDYATLTPEKLNRAMENVNASLMRETANPKDNRPGIGRLRAAITGLLKASERGTAAQAKTATRTLDIRWLEFLDLNDLR
jgi:hypothetical protein